MKYKAFFVNVLDGPSEISHHTLMGCCQDLLEDSLAPEPLQL